MKRWETIEPGTRRAPRYIVQLALEYRLKGERTWSRGRSHNFSRSGILFSLARTLPGKAQLVIRVPLPLEDGTVVCNAKAVREDAVPGTVAVAISRYRFERSLSRPIN